MSDQKIVPIPHSLLVKVFELDGFTVKRKKGDHVIMTKRSEEAPGDKNKPGSYKKIWAFAMPYSEVRAPPTTGDGIS